MGLLSLVTFMPILGALLLLLIPATQERTIKMVAIATGVLTFALSLVVLSRFDSSTYKFQLMELVEWIPSLGINYRMGVDGISIWLVILTALLSVIALGYSVYVKTNVKSYMALLLLLETSMLGAFLSLDMIVFYSFFELSLIPMYFLIAIWGGERRKYAAAKFFIYTFAGSILMLVGMVMLAFLYQRQFGIWTFSILDIQAGVANGVLWTGALQAQLFTFWAFAIAFLVKSPAFPFHTWIPDAYAEAPTAGPILSSVMVKMGTYGFLRFCLPLFPDALPGAIPILTTLAVIGILYGAILAAVQTDMRRLLAYSTVSHMGFVLLGIFSLNQIGLVGGAYQQLNHGITASALFLLVGYLIQRRGTAELREYGGLKERMPIFATLFLIAMLSSVGLPGLNGFVGEFLAMLGAFQSGYQHLHGLNTAFVAIAAGGVVLAAVYLLYMFQQVFYGPITNPVNDRLRDIKPWETGLACSLIVLMFWGGLYPSTFTKPMEASLEASRLMATSPANSRPMWLDKAPTKPVPGTGSSGGAPGLPSRGGIGVPGI